MADTYFPRQGLKWVFDSSDGALYVESSTDVWFGDLEHMASYTGPFVKNEATVKLAVSGTPQLVSPLRMETASVRIKTEEAISGNNQTPAEVTVGQIQNYLGQEGIIYRVIAQVIKPDGSNGGKATNTITSNDPIEIL